jgi:oxygen-independent coproporphyrinogen-3 oxidase
MAPVSYVEKLVRESLSYHSILGPLKTLYCGGGTPGLLGVDGFKALRQAPFVTFESNYEWTVELHPKTCTPTLLETLASIGVNRISIGVQSFYDPTLTLCNRRHTVAEAKSAITLARSIIPNTGIDLIAGLPEITSDLWKSTIEEALSFDLQHLSIYALSIDEGSRWYREGIKAPSEDFLCDAIEFAAQALESSGFERYETSNYAKPGYRCKHNLNTWYGGDYLGLGDGAASRLGYQRRDGLGEVIQVSPLEDALERMFTQLRLSDGIVLSNWIKRFPLLEPYLKYFDAHIKELQYHKLLDKKGAPTTRGYEVLDAIIRSFYDIVESSQPFV